MYFYKVLYEILNPISSRQIINFNVSLKDQMPLAAAIQNYTGQSS